MPRKYNELSDLKVKAAKEPGRHADGRGLSLQVTVGADKIVRRSWLLRVSVPGGKKREMGLGAYPTIDLAMARVRAEEARRLAASNVDPIAHREELKKEQQRKEERAITFKQAAEAFITSHESAWKNDKHRDQWRNTLETYAYPVFGSRPVQSVDLDGISKVLEPIWRTKTETASRVRSRIERILGWATVKGYRSGDNPARWKGHLENVFPQRGKVQKVKHHNALPYEKMPEFMRKLRTRTSVGARALEFTILNCTRTGESVRAHWREIDLDKRLWTIPSERMKAGKEHRVPLSDASMQLLDGLSEIFGEKGWLFPSLARPDEPLSNAALLGVLRVMKQTDITTHGFRSTFRDWAAEQTSFSREVAEAALAHTLESKVERAYQRRDLFDKRRELMGAWADYCGSARLKGNRIKRQKP